ncbi:hypothetical protein HK104_009517 [Borealophlyctis nickersoniae]|nr:hypothetical protein HK104_009517 [Borealophlyctis nickersoniae]
MVRFKNRYLLFEITWEDGVTDDSVDVRALSNTIRKSIEYNFGDYGAAIMGSGFSMKYYNPYTNVGIFRASRDHFRIAWTACTFITAIRGRSCIINVVHTAGTLKSVQTAAIERGKEILLDLHHKGLIKESRASELADKAKKDIMELDF